jgi:crotonobetainyl-CoA:carnitine CoA-transferase CaiB-like acyl-CoA transferase
MGAVSGQVAEWFKATVLKTVVGASLPWVRIPPCPPILLHNRWSGLMKMLEGIRILDMTSVIFGPYATQMLADMGAEVIKVEAPAGDMARYIGKPVKTPGMGSVHMTVNRGKKSIVLDLKKDEDQAVMVDLIKTADVFFHNVRMSAMSRLGFGIEAVRAIKADIIYVHGAGFGQDGPYADLQAYDDVIQAATGTTNLLSRVDGNPAPRYFPSLIADKVAGLYGSQAILAALIHKLRTGEGQHVEVPMFECFTNFMLEEHMQAMTFDPPVGPVGYPRQLDPGRQPFQTSDGWISVVPYTDAKIIQLFSILGASDVLELEQFNTQLNRFRNITALYGEIAQRMPTRTTEEWLAILADADIPAMVARDMSEIFDDPHLVATNFFRMKEHPTEGRYREMAPPIKFSADPNRYIGISPTLGEHGEEIRRSLNRK